MMCFIILPQTRMFRFFCFFLIVYTDVLIFSVNTGSDIFLFSFSQVYLDMAMPRSFVHNCRNTPNKQRDVRMMAPPVIGFELRLSLNSDRLKQNGLPDTRNFPEPLPRRRHGQNQNKTIAVISCLCSSCVCRSTRWGLFDFDYPLRCLCILNTQTQSCLLVQCRAWSWEFAGTVFLFAVLAALVVAAIAVDSAYFVHVSMQQIC